MIAKVAVLAGILAAIFVYFKFRQKDISGADSSKDNGSENALEMKLDPVCGSYTEETTKYKVRLHDKIYYFCSEECKNKFIEEKTN